MFYLMKLKQDTRSSLILAHFWTCCYSWIYFDSASSWNSLLKVAGVVLIKCGMKYLCDISSSQAKANAGYLLGFISISKSAISNKIAFLVW